MDARDDAGSDATTKTERRWEAVSGRIRPFREVILAGLLVLLFGNFWLRLDTFVSGRRGQALLDPDFWPGLLVATATVLSLAYLVLAILDVLRVQRGASAADGDAAGERAQPTLSDPEARDVPTLARRLRALAAFVLLGLYIYAMPTTGFVPITLVFTVAFLILLGERRWWFLIVLPIGVVAAVILVFTRLLVVPLPRGSGFFLELSTYLY